MSDRAVEAGRTAGTLLGVLSGAEVGTAAIRIPVVGPLMGAFVGGLIGSSAGQVLAMLASKGSSLVLDTFAMGLAKAANYGAKRAEAAVPEGPRPDLPPVPAPPAAGREAPRPDLPPVPAPPAAGREGGAKRTGG